MDQATIDSAMGRIEQTGDLLERALMLAGLVTTLFGEQGHHLVVVGGAAIDFFTEGQYMSGAIDLCRLPGPPMAPRMKQETMGRLGAVGGPRSWEVAGLFVDILGELETEARSPLRELDTPQGRIRVIQPEMVLVERVLTAVYPRGNEEDRQCAVKLLAAFIKGSVTVDWSEIERLAARPEYGVATELASLKEEVSRVIGC